MTTWNSDRLGYKFSIPEIKAATTYEELDKVAKDFEKNQGILGSLGSNTLTPCSCVRCKSEVFWDEYRVRMCDIGCENIRVERETKAKTLEAMPKAKREKARKANLPKCDRCNITMEHPNEVFLKDTPFGCFGDEIVLCNSCKRDINRVVNFMDKWFKEKRDINKA